MKLFLFSVMIEMYSMGSSRQDGAKAPAGRVSIRKLPVKIYSRKKETSEETISMPVASSPVRPTHTRKFKYNAANNAHNDSA